MATTSSLSDAYATVHHDSKHVIPLDFDSVVALPESHAWTADEARPADSFPIPVIDLTSPNVVDLIGNACKKTGTFQVTNHGIPSNLIYEVEAHARLLFSLPTEQKLKALRESNQATGYGVARISPFFEKLMWHEGFTIIGSPIEHAKKLWPDQYEEFCETMENYRRKMKSLADELMIILLKALELEEKVDQETSLPRFLLESEGGALQLNSYPICPNPDRAIGMAPHTDSLLLTIFLQNDTNGLQIFEEGVGWIGVPSVPGALVVNVGDLMHILSNARFHTVLHRVVPSETRHRYTVGYFYGPSTDSTIAPLIKGSDVPRFRVMKMKEYMRIKTEHHQKALDLIRV